MSLVTAIISILFVLGGLAYVANYLRTEIRRPGLKVILFLRVESTEWELAPSCPVRVVTMRKYVDLRVLPGIGFELDGHGLDKSRVERVELGHGTGNVVDASIYMTPHKVGLLEIDNQVKAFTQFLHWEVLNFMST